MGCTIGGFLIILVVLLTVIAILILRSKPPPLPSPPSRPLPSVDQSVFVLHSPQANGLIDVQTYVIARLQEYFDVSSSGDMDRGDVIEWIEMKARKADFVLLVFTKEFFSEWGSGTKPHVVKAAQRLLTSAVAQELLHRYAIIVMDEVSKKEFVPDNYYLKSMNVYVLGKESNEIEDLYRFITKSKAFEHQERVTISPDSSVSSDNTSQQTETTDVNPECHFNSDFFHPSMQKGSIYPVSPPNGHHSTQTDSILKIKQLLEPNDTSSYP